MLLLLHGAIGDQTQFDALRVQLGFTGVRTMDFEGHGARPMAGRPFRLEHFVENLLVWIAEHSPADQVDVFGYSMGGYVALCAAADAPTRIRSVLTLGTKLVWTPGVAAEAAKQLDPARLSEKVPAFASALAARHHATGWERVLGETAGALEALGQAPLLTPEVLARITCPVRLAVGDRDATVPVEELRDAARLLPRGEYEVLPNTPHPLERVPLERLAWTLQQFVSSAGM
jgi:pimeloyl-ACP methyl ester carboxylesterase